MDIVEGGQFWNNGSDILIRTQNRFHTLESPIKEPLEVAEKLALKLALGNAVSYDVDQVYEPSFSQKVNVCPCTVPIVMTIPISNRIDFSFFVFSVFLLATLLR